MIESIFAENMFGVKSYYELNVISKSNDSKEITIKSWNGKLKKLKLDDKKKCYVVREENN
jgi:hypothetical protein